ncbi:septum formation initiator family protein [Patescibacteria group bacterium]
MKRKIISLVVILVGIGLIFSLSRSIWRLLKAGDRIRLAQQQAKDLEEESLELREKKEYYQSEIFVEGEARNKLNLSKEGETVVVLPENLEELVEQEKYSGNSSQLNPEALPSWQQWWHLFF